MRRISLKAVEATVKDVCNKYFDFDFESLGIPVKIVDKNSNYLGEFTYNCKSRKPIAIEFSKQLVSGIYKIETVESVIKHEIAHLVLFIKGEEFHDGTKNFEETIERIGSTSSRVIRPLIHYHAKCSCCGKRCLNTFSKSVYRRYINSDYLLTDCCNSKMIPDGKTILKDKTKFKNDDAGELLRRNIKLENENENDNTIMKPNVHLVAYKNRKIKIKEEA